MHSSRGFAAVMPQFLLLLSGVFFCSTSVIIIRLSELPPSLLAAYRLLFATVLLSPPFFLAWKKHRTQFSPQNFRRCLAPAVILAAHFITWAWGARLTYTANATLIINLTPVVMPFLAHFMIRERVTKREVLGTCVAIVGVVILALGAVKVDPQFLWGNVICFGSMIAFATYLAFGRINRDFPSIWLYMIPIYAIAGAICMGFSALTLESISVRNWREAGLMLAMALLPTTLGHITLNRSLRYFAAQTFAVVNLHQFVFAGIMGWIVFNDIPPNSFYLASALCIGGAVLIVMEMARLRGGAKS